MSLEQAASPLFANHQTFHPRFGWIKKGYDASASNPNVFNEPASPVTLGVGKNMVEAIRFWSAATKVTVRLPHPDRPRLSVYSPTKFGEALFDDDYGLDPYGEDPTTLWILHWKALSPTSLLPVWRAAFNDFTPIEFTEQELLQFCIDEIASTTWSQPKPSSVAKDVDCLLRMYTRRETQGRQTIDDLLDSPFRELELIVPAPGKRGNYRFVRGAKRGLTSAAVVYACLDFMTRDTQRTCSLTRLSADPGSPGRLFKITETEILEAIEEVAARVGGLSITRPSGSNLLVVDRDPSLVALAVLWAHHSTRLSDRVNVEDLELAGVRALAPVLDQDEIAHRITRAAKATNAKMGPAA